MKQHMRAGWEWMKDHVYVWVILFLYQLLWGFFLYRFIDSIVVPILRRYPTPAPSDMSAQIFMMESQFQLTKTSAFSPYLWALIGFIALRLLLTPVIHAGVVYAMAHHRSSSHLTFFRGIAAAWKPITLLYIIETILIIAPSYWVVPYFAKILTAQPNGAVLLTTVAPIVLGWLIGGWLLHQLFLFLQFGAASDTSMLHALKRGLRRLLPVIGISLLFLFLSACSGAIATAAAMFWTGMTALILQQALPALQTMLKLWSMASRYYAWEHTSKL